MNATLTIQNTDIPMHKVYENVVIGNFLYGLGYSIGANISHPLEILPSSVNLLQQTPDDKLLADVLLEFPGLVRLIEFKRASNKDAKEKEKNDRLLLKLRKLDLSVCERMRVVSRAVHWFVETDPKKDSFITKVVPYLDTFSIGNEAEINTMESLIARIAHMATSGGEDISTEEYKNYLSLVACCNGPDDSTIQTSGLLIAASGEGGIRIVELSDLMQLRLQHKEYVHGIIFREMTTMSKETTINKQNLVKHRHTGKSLDLEFRL